MSEKTKVYFIRHAEPNYQNENDMERELTAKGLADTRLITAFLEDRPISAVISSPYKRTVDTVKDYANKYNHQIITEFDFRERKISDEWITDFDTFCQCQWEDFDYKLGDGESLGETQNRNIKLMNGILDKYNNHEIVISTHGTALCTILNYYDDNYGYDFFCSIKNVFPAIIICSFEDKQLTDMHYIGRLKKN